MQHLNKQETGESIDALNISPFTKLYLISAGITTIAKLKLKSEAELRRTFLEIRRAGVQRSLPHGTADNIIAEIQQALEEYGCEHLRTSAGDGRHFTGPKNLSATYETSHFKATTPEEEAIAQKILGNQFKLFQQFREGTPAERLAARNQIMEQNLNLVGATLGHLMNIIGRIRDPMLAQDSLLQEGALGLMHAVERYDYTRGVRFSTYAHWWIKQAMWRAIAEAHIFPVHLIVELQRLNRITYQIEMLSGERPTIESLAARMNTSSKKILDLFNRLRNYDHPLSLDASLQNDANHGATRGDLVSSGSSIEESLCDAETHKKLTKLVEEIFDACYLFEQERVCIERRFCLNGGDGETLEEVGAYLGVTRERVRQIEKRVLGLCQNKQILEKIKYLFPEDACFKKKPKCSVQRCISWTRRAKVARENLVRKMCESFGQSLRAIRYACNTPELQMIREIIIARLINDLEWPISTIAEMLNLNTQFVRTYQTSDSQEIEHKKPKEESKKKQGRRKNETRHIPLWPSELAKQKNIECLNKYGVTKEIIRGFKDRWGVQTIEQLARLGKTKILMSPKMDTKTLEYLQSILEQWGLDLSP
ncbi:MAG: hypothetical protein A3B74_00770 [Candidatus Kerfeldbacteria bacterium RIFCSPHIGHO2_02_FULL_42_14]|uniref:RNA polymerase sigma-70 domain-containing protein n=1 Tax=Candidatus Kerfeldbacteria bacterium RIFCSPHIGHO2_02_FULL_42_14 TaxID=1798540 RepID=A0A1G2AR26_9BACT|nr:MAG: hypothetical protein A3B74_00770 [Candidatus Kerfeldbacteria bacterium RIFCSPHIGHO2_02_FULL_42_14]OGY81890.1 MAG: hypothetical protein A3E60_00850 [Candidatus Kerfeldbacteria bacterium RIFCSPHIGHO2_12_FULL_42_13]OGY83475.1 MAG: hypothetical protein A3I91_02405 [Candidatus Kerfeldbacteria bacterium RIFCSPLOWO2_02_FULL_42_19]OGY86999.1 MAG: hypothetical protein A3G01_01805 [Candidatus Kerfeldbacteria bacterium RIFCSPLOWO2_12_FULL_43_9]